MIKVTVQLIPFGIGEPKLLGEAIIYNDGTGTHSVGNYTACFGARGRPLRLRLYPQPGMPHVANSTRTARVTSFPRLRKNAWHLLALALAQAGYLKTEVKRG